MPEAHEGTQPTPSGATPGVALDPYRNYNFKVSIPGFAEAHFKECSNLGIKVDVIAYREAGASAVVRWIPGRTEYEPVTLSYGLTASKDLWEWVLTGVKGTVQRKRLTIIMLDADGQTEHLRWNLNNAWVSEWRGAPLDAMGQEIAIERITVVFETLDRD